MCGRFNYSNSKRLEGDLPPRYNIAPGTNILVVNEDNLKLGLILAVFVNPKIL